MALTNINFSAIKCEGDNGEKIIVTVYADVSDWEAVAIEDDAALGALLMDAVVDALETP
jgi:hypothetical protein